MRGQRHCLSQNDSEKCTFRPKRSRGTDSCGERRVRDFKATARKRLPCFARLLADWLQFNVERCGRDVLGTVPLGSHSRLPHQTSGIKKREHKRSMHEASVDPEAQSPAVDPRDRRDASARSNSDHSFPFTLDAQGAFSQNFLHQILCPVGSRKTFFSQQMRKVPASTLEEKGYNQEGWWWDFDGLKPGTLRGSLENCSPDTSPAEPFSLWYRQVYKVHEPLSKPHLVSSFPHCVSQHLTKAWQEATNVCSHEWEENAQKTLLKGLLDSSWFPEEREMLMMGAGQRPDGDYAGLTVQEHPTLPYYIWTKIFHIFLTI